MILASRYAVVDCLVRRVADGVEMQRVKQNVDAESRYFDAVADQRAFDEFSEEQYAEILSAMLSGVPSGGRILDAGCGSGAWLSALCRGGWDGLGVELAPAQVKQARALGLNAVVGDLLTLPPGLGMFDGAILCGVLHHFPSRQERTRVIRNVAKTLKPGGSHRVIGPERKQPFRAGRLPHALRGEPERTLSARTGVDCPLPCRRAGSLACAQAAH